MRDENTEEGPSTSWGEGQESAQGEHGASPEGSLGGGMEMRVWMTELQRVQCPCSGH